MADIKQLERALIKADAAGDDAGARVLAAEIRKMRAVPASIAQPIEREATAGDQINAVTTGLNRGGVTFALGLPVDTVLNVADLAKAGVGSAYMGITGDSPPGWLEPKKRDNYVGSSAWIERQARENGAGGLITPSGPDTPTIRTLHSMGMGAGGAIAGGRINAAPMTKLALTRNVATGAAGGAAAAIAIENGASPEVAMLASMAPQAGGAAIAGGAKMAARGGEAGRQAMAQRIQDFKNAGIDNPSVGLASGRPTLQGIENLLANTPGGVGAFERSKNALLAGMQDKTAQVRDQASTRYGADVSGRAVQGDLSTLLNKRISAGYDRADSKMQALIPPSERFPISNSLAALSEATAINPLAPATTAGFVQPRIASLRENMLLDTQPATPWVYGVQNPNKGMPVSATSAIRTSIGKEAASKAIMGTPEQADFKRVYGGLSEDIRGAARQTDMGYGPQPNNVGPAERSFNRGNALYSAGMDRIDRVQPFVNKLAPEEAFTSLMQSGKENVSTMRAVKKSVSPETRGSLAATWIDRLGRATPGKQNELSDVFSPDRLLTNWNTMTPKARTELLSGFKGAKEVASSMDDIAKAASMLKDSSKVWANPSGTGANTTARVAFGATAVGGFLSLPVAAAAAGAMGTVNAASRLMTNKKFVTWLADSTRTPSSQGPAQLMRLTQMANGSGDEQFKRDVREYTEKLREQADQEQED